MAIGKGRAAGGGQAQPGPPPPLVTSASPSFKLVLLLVFSLTLAAMVACIILATWGRDNEQTKQLIDAFTKGYLMGLAGILGLIGGRVL